MDPNSLAYKIYAEQKRLNFPGLIQECLLIAKELKIETEFESTTISIFKFKKIVKDAVKSSNESSLREKIAKSQKLQFYKNEQFEN